MADYIERGALDKALTIAAANGKDKDRRTWAKAICVLHDAPAADVAPVVHGLWVEHLNEMECSVCKRQWNYCDNDTNTFNFCPNCGAKMDGGASKCD